MPLLQALYTARNLYKHCKNRNNNVAVAGASSALTGLVFVGISINLTKILSIRGLPGRALLSIVLLIHVLVISMLFLVPGQSTTALGAEVLIVGLITWTTVLRLDLRSLTSKERQHKRQQLFNMLIDQVATILFIVAGTGFVAGRASAAYSMVLAILLSIVKAVVDGWVLLIEINR